MPAPTPAWCTFQQAMAPLGLSILLVDNVNRQPILDGVQHRLAAAPRLPQPLLRRRSELFGIAQSLRHPRRLHHRPTRQTGHLDAQSFVASPSARGGLAAAAHGDFAAQRPDRELTTEERSHAAAFVIKPSFGVAARGTVVGVAPTAAAIAAARQFNRNDDWLIQKMITWTRAAPTPVLRDVTHLFGNRSLLWWVKENGIDKYTPPSPGRICIATIFWARWI